MSSLKLKTPSGGSVSFNAEDTGSDYTLTVPAGNANVLTNTSSIPAANLTGDLPAGMGGKILQVVSTTKTDTYTQNSNTFTDIPSLSVSITPSSTSSKILVFAVVNGFAVGNYNFQGRLMRDSTPIFIGDAAGSRPRSSFQTFAYSGEHNEQIAITHLDSPSSTSALTYKVQVKSGSFIGINRTELDRDTSNYDARMASSITVMEVGA